MVTEKLTPRVGDVWRDNNSRGAPRCVAVLDVGIGYAHVRTCDESGIRTGDTSFVNLKAFSPHLKPRRTGFTLARRDGEGRTK